MRRPLRIVALPTQQQIHAVAMGLKPAAKENNAYFVEHKEERIQAA